MYLKSFLVSYFAALAAALPAAEPQDDLAAPASAGNPVRPAWATIDSISFGGPGCPAGSVNSTMSGDRTIINMIFEKFYVERKDSSTPISEMTKNCNVNIRVRFPPGFSLTVATTDVRGFTVLGKTCKATIGSRSWWSGQQRDASIQSSIDGAYVGEYLKSMSVPTTALVWSSCSVEGPLFNVDTRLLVDCRGNNKGLVQVSTNDVSLRTPLQWSLGLQWKKC